MNAVGWPPLGLQGQAQWRQWTTGGKREGAGDSQHHQGQHSQSSARPEERALRPQEQQPHMPRRLSAQQEAQKSEMQQWLWQRWRTSRSRREAISMLEQLLSAMGGRGGGVVQRGHTSGGDLPGGSAAAAAPAQGPLAAEGSHEDALEGGLRRRGSKMSAWSSDLVSTQLGPRDAGDVVWDTDEELKSETAPKPPITTLMIRNIPADCTIDTLLQAWPMDGSYDFLYLPMSSHGKTNLRYAFINLVTEAHASAFFSQWQSNRLPQLDRGRRLNITVANVQGLEANVQQLKAKPADALRARRCTPIILKEGRQVGLDEF